MSRIDELIAEHCAEGVEFRPLADITGKSTSIKWACVTDASFKYIDLSSVDRVTRRIGDTISVTAADAPSRARQIVRTGDVIFATTRPAQMRWAVIPSEYDGQIASTGYCVLRPNNDVILTNFLAHILGTGTFSRYVESNQVEGNYPSIPDSRVREFRVPVPPLEVQREIVRILDTFSKMEVELEAELEARKQQYEHYRAEILSENTNGVSTPLGEIFEMRAGTHVKASEISDDQLETHPYRCFGGNGVRGYVSGYNYDEDVAFIGRQGALCGNVHRAQGKIYATEHAVVVTPKAEVDMSWAFHKLTEMDLNQYKTKSAQPGLAVSRIKEIVISLPKIKEQRRIVEILDKFDELVNDLSTGLPAELAARRQQYEYYRDKLLTFKELEPVS